MRCIASGEFGVALPAGEAIEFFTPEGERDWVPEWQPVYPSGEPGEKPGTVFTTDVAGVHTIWVILEIDRVGGTAAYARVTPGHHAGTVRVRCSNVADGGCVAMVSYDMSLLPGADPFDLDPYRIDAFETMMSEWATAIRRIVATPGPNR